MRHDVAWKSPEVVPELPGEPQPQRLSLVRFAPIAWGEYARRRCCGCKAVQLAEPLHGGGIKWHRSTVIVPALIDRVGCDMHAQHSGNHQEIVLQEKGGSMRSRQWNSVRVSKGIVVALVLALSGALIAGSSSRAATEAQSKIEATIFSYDGQDFLRIKTTLVTEDGKSAVNTKLDRGTPAYKSLMRKRSYTGDATIFGRKYEANYAPLTDKDDRLTGALFVAVRN